MRICAIFNVWDDWDLFELAYKNILPLVDGVIVVASSISNYGEVSIIPASMERKGEHYLLNPVPGSDAGTNETQKRNFGLYQATQAGYTHFINMDADEFYSEEEFNREKKRFIDNPDLAGLVCRVKCYFKSPTLTIGYDTTLVPFIHKITPNLRFEFNRKYPFAWTALDGIPHTHTQQIRIDPTRSMNINNGVEWSDITMHHYSWVRKDIHKKIRNSTARANIERSSIVRDYANAKPGYFCQFYGKTLTECPNVFGLPEPTEIDDTSIQQENS